MEPLPRISAETSPRRHSPGSYSPSWMDRLDGTCPSWMQGFPSRVPLRYHGRLGDRKKSVFRGNAMSSLDNARETQLKNIVTKTGKTLVELREMIQKSGLTKHSEVRQMLIDTFSLGYGD